jgi:DNA-binding transcriptional LysR family regulator
MPFEFKHLSLRQLRLVAKLGTALNLSSAAHELHMTQPAASRSLAQLESLLGVRLFERQHRTLVPTAAGVRFIHHAQRVLDQLGAAELEMSGASVVDELRIGAIASFSSALLARACVRASERFPETRIKVSTGAIGALYSQLLSGTIDLMAAHAELTVDLNRVVVSSLYVEHTAVVANPGHRLARRKSLGWQAIANQPWILPPAFTPSRPKIERILAVHRCVPAPVLPDLEVESSAVALQLLRQKEYLWSLASREAGFWERSGLVRVLPHPEMILQGPMCLLRLKDRAPTEELLEMARLLAESEDR